MDRYDLVLGSRFVKGGRDADRSLVRRFITFLVRRFIRRRFRFPVRDVSSGFRCFRREVLEAVDLDDLISVGPSVVLEILYKAFLLGFRIGEVPIVFVDRKTGQDQARPPHPGRDAGHGPEDQAPLPGAGSSREELDAAGPR